ncbi:MAG: ligase-associated DNA damage response DEXH box helicase [Phycisphaeraceae bacterium]
MSDAASNHAMRTAERWMAEQGRPPFDFQRAAWAASLAGRSGLIHAPTGMGKTLAAWLGPVCDWLQRHPKGWSPPASAKRKLGPPIEVLWLTPLRALANDTEQSLRRPIDDLGLPWTIERRTGDVSYSIKKRQRERLPTALITTPESVSLLLSYPEARTKFKTLRTVIVDEWHELLGTKRGTQTQLALARLRKWIPDLRIWGLSATLGNLDQALHHLIGVGAKGGKRRGTIIAGPTEKDIELDILLPEDIERFPWAGHIGLKLIPQVVEKLREAKTTLIFTNTRAQAEIWFSKLMSAAPDLLGSIALHHGSLDPAIRNEVEAMLGEGRLRAVVCTSSLDLGVDFPAVDQVMQVGSPKGVARLMQRAGRSGHQPGRSSRVVCVASHAFELVEFSAAREALAHRRLEDRPPYDRPLDVLVQHVVTCATGGGFDSDALYSEVKTAACCAELTREQWRWVMDFVERGGEALTAYPQYARIKRQNNKWGPSTPTIGKDHRMGIGTIASDPAMLVKYNSGKTLGTIEESFVTKLRPGERFTFSGKTLELIRIRDMAAYVKPSKYKRGTVARWNGGRFPLSTQLADGVVQRFAEFAQGTVADAAIDKIAPLLGLQMRRSKLPTPGTILVERTKLRDGWHTFAFFFQGRLVHEGLAALIAHRLTEGQPASVGINVNDYGIELLTDNELQLGEDDWHALLSPTNLVDDLLECVNATVLARRQFREIARIAGLIVPQPPGGKRRSGRQLQATSEMFYEVLTEYDAGNMLLHQAKREVLDQQLEFARLRDAIDRIRRTRFETVTTERLTPLAFPLFADRLRAETVSTEQWEQRLLKQIEQMEEG